MFFGSKKENREIENVSKTLIGQTVKVDGEFFSNEDVDFAGTMDGNIKIEGDIWVLPEALIQGSVHANNIIVAGTVEGNCSAVYDVIIEKTGTVKGDVMVGGKFTISPGAVFLGSSKMSEKQEEVDTEVLKDDDIDLDLDL